LYFLVTIVLTLVVVVGTWLLWRKKEREVVATLKSPDEKRKSTCVDMDRQPLESVLEPNMQQESSHTAPTTAFARSRAISDWAQPNRQNIV
jgi:ABC-type nickel/cobalt efflux system permease component RcnA